MNLFDVYPLFDINIVKGKGCHVWDENGTEYLDLYGGHAVISIGHAHPHYVEMISNQVATLGFYSNSVINKLQEQVTERLGKVCGYDDYSLFLINSGAEANENALKLASFYNGRTRMVSFNKAFHGRTSLAVEVTNNPKIIAPINDCGHVTYLPLNDIEAMKNELAKGDVCAVIIEGIQGVGGIQLPTDEFMQALREACTAHNTILVLDEIQSGYGRSGKFFAHQYNGIKADIITVAKGIGNGFPMAGVLISPMFTPVYGQLGTTFGGNHLACSAALAVLDVIGQENLVENAAKVGEYLMTELKKFPQIKEVRGRGLMIGLEFEETVERTTCIYRCQRYKCTPPASTPLPQHGRSQSLPRTFQKSISIRHSHRLAARKTYRSIISKRKCNPVYEYFPPTGLSIFQLLQLSYL